MPRTTGPVMTPEEFRRIGRHLVDRIADHMAKMPTGPVKPDEAGPAVRDALSGGRGLPHSGADPEALVNTAADLLFNHSLFNGHPRFFGYITSSPAPIGVLGDLLASAVNQNCGGWTLSPMASEIEAQTVRWIADFIGFRPSGAAEGSPNVPGLLVSGGNMANFVCLLAARTAKAGVEVREAGLKGGDLVIYGSAETHTWIQKAADLFGFGTRAIRWIAVDDQQRMRVDELRRQIEADRAAGVRPFVVVGTAGSVGTGAVDPLAEIAAVCRDQNLWFHVDGAYGAFAAGAPGAPDALAAIADADSVAVDPHKWLYAPLEAGCALVKRTEDLRNTFSYHPPYYRFKEEPLNFVDYGPQNSRGFRALKVWLALQQIGKSGYAASIAEDIKLAQRLFDRLKAHPEFQPLTQSLSITTFRYVPQALRRQLGDPAVEQSLNALNETLLERIERSGQAFFSNAVIKGTFALRACIVNFRTTEQDIDVLPELVAAHGRSLPAA